MTYTIHCKIKNDTLNRHNYYYSSCPPYAALLAIYHPQPCRFAIDSYKFTLTLTTVE